jgi:hypothetical protein
LPSDLDVQFNIQRKKESEWPCPLPEPEALYTKFRHKIHRLANNLVCASCACISHDVDIMHFIPFEYPQLSLLQVDPSIIPYDFSTGFSILDDRHVLIEKSGIHINSDTSVPSLWLCPSCYLHLSSNQLPPSALSNYRWLGDVPDVLQDLTRIEERLIACVHISGMIYRLERKSNCSYLGLKGHAVIYPQDTRVLLDILPLPPSRLPETIRVVWTGK